MVAAVSLARPGTVPPLFERITSRTSRVLEFFTEKELAMQLGTGRAQWALALLKELLDNALDACESRSVPPTITVSLTPDTLTVTDNGPGLPYATLVDSLDYLIRVSDKAYYVSPTRGQLGNALKGVWAAPFVVDGREGRVTVQTAAYAYDLCVRLDRIAQQPEWTLVQRPDAIIQSGTMITLYWPEIASEIDQAAAGLLYNDEYEALVQLLVGYAAFNPHATFILVRAGESPVIFPASRPGLAKWHPKARTSPHWYTVRQLRDLLTATLAADREAGRRRFVREVVADFHGLTRSNVVPSVIREAGLYGAALEDLVAGEDMPLAPVQQLLHAMQARSRPIKPTALGVLGEGHLRTILTQHLGIADETITYKAVLGTCPDVTLPYVVEVACGWSLRDAEQGWQITGVNWTPGLRVPFPAWRSLLNTCRVDTYDQVSLLVHLACPFVAVTDRAKSAVELPMAITEAIRAAVHRATKDWQRLKAAADKRNRVRAKALEEDAKRQRRQQISIKEAAWQVMEAAYLQASDHGRLPANARQIMYAARPMVITLRAPAKIWKNDSQFTQGYLPDFIAAHPDLTREWDVVYDDRGHFTEPHTRETFGLGTLKVRRYRQTWATSSFTTPDGEVLRLDQIETSGPHGRYRYVLFLEKEGFDELLAAGQIAARYDLAIMSTKGQTVTAARTLIEALSRQGVTFLVAHDFDKAGIEILDKFWSATRRFTYTSQTNVIDLGLRLTDVEAMGLASEPEGYGDIKDPRVNLRRCGATDAEVAFLVAHRDYTGEWHGARVELNAMTSRQFLDWLEAKFAAIGIEKVVPDTQTVTRAYQHLFRNALLARAIEHLQERLPDAETIVAPPGLVETLRTRIAGTTQSWDGALWAMVRNAVDTEEDEDDDTGPR